VIQPKPYRVVTVEDGGSPARYYIEDANGVAIVNGRGAQMFQKKYNADRVCRELNAANDKET